MPSRQYTGERQWLRERRGDRTLSELGENQQPAPTTAGDRYREALDRLVQAIVAREGGTLTASRASMHWRLPDYDEFLAAVEEAASALNGKKEVARAG